jgi:hypothetical protein
MHDRRKREQHDADPFMKKGELEETGDAESDQRSQRDDMPAVEARPGTSATKRGSQ